MTKYETACRRGVLDGVDQLRSAAQWSGAVRESFWDGWRAQDILALYVGWQEHDYDEYPDQASRRDVVKALLRGRAQLKRRGAGA
jgi:hypothetical protein